MLKGDRVILGPIKRDYIETYLKWMNNPELTQYLLIYRPLTREMEEDWYNSLKNRENFFIFAILIYDQNKNEKLIGNCSIDVNWQNRVGTCGIMVGETENQGKGYGTEAMKLLVEYGFNTLNLNRIQLETYDFNIRALKSYKKVGFKEEGTRRKAIFKNGEYHDVIMMGILKDEWPKKDSNE
ncbi:MAG: GNAT family N-acetyltransferase [Candidatus Hodarchaeota archaeon]